MSKLVLSVIIVDFFMCFDLIIPINHLIQIKSQIHSKYIMIGIGAFSLMKRRL